MSWDPAKGTSWHALWIARGPMFLPAETKTPIRLHGCTD